MEGMAARALSQGGSNRAKPGAAAELSCLVSLFHPSFAHRHHPLTLPVAFPSLASLTLGLQTLHLPDLKPRLGFAHTELSRCPLSAPRGVVETHPVAYGREVWGCFSRNAELWGCFSPRNNTSSWSWISSPESCLSQVPHTASSSSVAPPCLVTQSCSVGAAFGAERPAPIFGCSVGVWGATHCGSVGVSQ